MKVVIFNETKILQTYNMIKLRFISIIEKKEWTRQRQKRKRERPWERI